MLHPLIRRLENKAHPLRYLFLEITRRCNLACRHCGSDCSKKPFPDELTTDEWLSFFSYLKKSRQGRTRSCGLVITGGEPLCHPDLDRILEGLRENGLAWGMVTNGWNLSPPVVQKLIEGGLVSITVSLDGLKDQHDWLRGREGSYERATRGLWLLSQANLPCVDVVTCVHPGNIDQLPKIKALLQKMGNVSWRLFSIFPKGRADKNRELLLDEAGYRRMLSFIRDARKSDNDMHIEFSCEGYLPSDWDRAVRENPYFCRAGISVASVLCDGAISACPNISRKMVQGNIRQDDFFEVWKDRFEKYRKRNWMRTGECVGCREFKRCQGNSMHLWDFETNRTALCTCQHAHSNRNSI
jgi:radical SAM protein with 4Fe4S-binding SPASM domain